MQISKITNILQKQPFQPFEIVTSSGSRYLVKHPELVWVAKGALYVSQRIEQPEEGEMVADPATISYMHITELVPVPEKAA
ncbi:MAG: hypothetical protein AAGC44_00090 [Planctomycetota bacterium]